MGGTHAAVPHCQHQADPHALTPGRRKMLTQTSRCPHAIFYYARFGHTGAARDDRMGLVGQRVILVYLLRLDEFQSLNSARPATTGQVLGV